MDTESVASPAGGGLSASEQAQIDAEFHTSDSLKSAGNDEFKAGRFTHAVDCQNLP